jgi:tetratricopeptide (TPR) repeat protein
MNKFAKISIPLTIGVAILLSYQLLKKSPNGVPPPAASGSTSPAPQDPTHERAALEEELRKNPGHAPILLRLAELSRDQGKTGEAVSYLRQLLEADPSNGDARLELGRALYDSGDIEGALRETRQLLADHPGHVDGLYNLGAIYANQNQLDLARQYWRDAVATAPTSDSGRKAQDALQKLGP